MRTMVRTMFGPAKSKELAEVVSLRTPEEARESAAELKRKFNDAKSRKRKVHIKRATVQASNRAFASAKKKDLSRDEKTEMKMIGRIYALAYRDMDLPEKGGLRAALGRKVSSSRRKPVGVRSHTRRR